MGPTSGKAAGSVAATQRAKQMAGTVPSTTRKPVTRATNGKKRSLSACICNTVYKDQERKKDHGPEIWCVNNIKSIGYAR